LSQLYAWRYDWIYNNLESYLSFYADEFIRFDGMDLERFKKYKERVFAKSEAKKIIFTNLNVIPYPGQTNTYQITFFEIYTSNSFQFSGQKTLIVRLNSANKMQIITEK
jgi:murein L,D-transpeptidase YafK